MFQGFTPGGASLRRVVLRLRAGGTFPASGTLSSVTVRADSPRAEPLASAEVIVSGPRATGEQINVTYGFPAGTRLTPGRLYVIGWSSPRDGDGVLTWMAATGNPYPSGQAYNCIGTATPDEDFIFATYGE